VSTTEKFRRCCHGNNRPYQKHANRRRTDHGSCGDRYRTGRDRYCDARVLFHWAGQEVHISAVVSEDASTGRGESLIFSRNAAGQVVASVHLRDNGQVVITTTGAVVGNGASPVALAQKVDMLWTALWGVINGWTPVYETALKANFLVAFPPPGPQTVGSSNLKAD
jgi:hypothetical protein